MLLEILLLLLLILLLFYLAITKNGWVSPGFLFTFPFIIMIIVSEFYSAIRDFKLHVETFLVVLLGVVFFLLASIIVEKTVMLKNKGLILKFSDKNIIRKYRLLFVVLLETFFLFLYIFYVIRRGNMYNYTFIESINRIMLNGKFGTFEEDFSLPIYLSIGIQMNFIVSYLFSYLIAKRIILKEKINLFILIIGFLLSNMTCFLGGSRGPILENFAGLILAFGIVKYKQNGKRWPSLKMFLFLTIFVSFGIVIFFNILPLMGRQETADNFADSFAQYIGSQIYNLDSFISNVNSKSTLFGANTLKVFYGELNSMFGIDLKLENHIIENYFVEINGHNLGNVFTTFFNFYCDGGIVNVVFCSFFMGFVSQLIFSKIKSCSFGINNFFVVYLYIAVSVLFSFFASRFFQNIVSIKFMFKIVWLVVLNFYLYDGKIVFYRNKLYGLE